MRKSIFLILIFPAVLFFGCGKSFKTEYFGVEDEAIFAPKEFAQTIEAVERAKAGARSEYQYRKIEEAMEQGRLAAITYWECNDEEARALLALARQSAYRSEMYHPQPPPPLTSRAYSTLDPPPPPESLTPDAPVIGLTPPPATGAADPDVAVPEPPALAVTAPPIEKPGIPAAVLAPAGPAASLSAVPDTVETGFVKNGAGEVRVISPVFAALDHSPHVEWPAGTPICKVHFHFASSRLFPDSTTVLDNMLEDIGKYQELNLELAGYADSMGPEAFNLRLSEKRAKAVADYLRQKGVDTRRMTIKAYGEADPIATNDTPQGRSLNRRVEVNIRKP